MNWQGIIEDPQELLSEDETLKLATALPAFPPSPFKALRAQVVRALDDSKAVRSVHIVGDIIDGERPFSASSLLTHATYEEALAAAKMLNNVWHI